MISRFQLPPESLDVLAAGQIDPPTLALLRRAQLSKNLLLIRAVLQTLPSRGWHRRQLDAGYSLLAAVQGAASDVVDELIRHPQVGAWAVHCLRAIRRGERGPAFWMDVAHLNALAATAAVRAGLPGTVPVPVRAGNVMLPTLGAARLPVHATYATLRVPGSHASGSSGASGSFGAIGSTHVTVSAGGRTVAVPAPADVETPDWRPVRRLRAVSGGRAITVYLDDLHPFRIYPGLVLAGRLADTEVAAWAGVFSDAWDLLVREHCEQTIGLPGGLSSLVPLAHVDGVHRSATCPESFGAVALSFTPDPAMLAAALVHEFQHTKLGALLDLVPLYRVGAETGPPELFYAPWREDPRPLGALLHGTYAFLGVAGFWRVQRQVSVGSAADHAHFQFAWWRAGAHAATTTLRDSGLLTEPGERFVAGMAATLETWLQDEVPPAPARRAAQAALSHSIRWRPRPEDRLSPPRRGVARRDDPVTGPLVWADDETPTRGDYPPSG